MTFTSVTFLIFFPIVILSYFLIPKRFRNVWLLFCSYFFYLTQPRQMVVYLLFVSAVTYISGRLLEVFREKITACKTVLFTSIALMIAGLAIFKYCPVQFFNLFMPAGISFFTFQSISYLIDIYRGAVGSEKSIVNVFLYVSFFPTILSGPIQRGSTFIPQLCKERDFDVQKARDGLYCMLWGYFLKMVIAGRLQILN